MLQLRDYVAYAGLQWFYGFVVALRLQGACKNPVNRVKPAFACRSSSSAVWQCLKIMLAAPRRLLRLENNRFCPLPHCTAQDAAL